MAPRIAMNASLLNQSSGHDLSVTVKTTYPDAVLEAGGAPIVLPPISEPATLRQLLGEVDGLMLIGGDDMSAERFGEANSPMANVVDPRREEFDFLILEEALALDLPILAVCLGCQVLNVHHGGTIYQDLAAERPESTLSHTLKTQPPFVRHPVRIAPDTLLARIAGAESLDVNSCHHQAIREPGRGLTVSARAPDGVIEAVEDPTREFVLGVQWHPEEITGEPGHAALFSAFVRAAAQGA